VLSLGNNCACACNCSNNCHNDTCIEGSGRGGLSSGSLGGSSGGVQSNLCGIESEACPLSGSVADLLLVQEAIAKALAAERFPDEPNFNITRRSK
jgi:hypothetical protein